MTYINQNNLRGIHRSGWQYCIDFLKQLHNDKGVLCDLYLDRTFHWGKDIMNHQGIIPYTSPWIGFIHHCPNTEFTKNNTIELINDPLFIKSLPMCKGIITLSNYLRDFIIDNINSDIPIMTLYHPTLFVDKTFTMDNLINNQDRKLINIGGWYRNTASIYYIQVDHIKKSNKCFKSKCCKGNYPITKAILKGKHMDCYIPPSNFTVIGSYNDKHFIKIVTDDTYEGNTISSDPCCYNNKWAYYMEKYINDNNLLVDLFDFDIYDVPYKFKFHIDEQFNSTDLVPDTYPYLLRNYLIDIINDVDVINFLNDDEYDDLLSRNIVFLNLIDASATNTIIECIVRNTPIIVNRHPAIEEYLGKEYPLYYDTIEDVNRLMSYKNIKSGYKYLRCMNKDHLHIESFIRVLKQSELYNNL
jgi:hypothetical protein